MNEVLVTSLKAQAESLKVQAKALEGYLPIAEKIEPEVFKFTCADLSDEQRMKSFIDKLPTTGKWLYILTTNQPEELLQGFREISSETKGSFKFARLNDFGARETVYVGSSNSLRQRIKGHFGFGNAATFSLKLKMFECAGDVGLELKWFKVETDDQTILQNIEDGLWNELKPMFGKPGANNKIKRTPLN